MNITSEKTVGSPDPAQTNGRGGKIPLFREYPVLEKRLPYLSLATLPTPVERLTAVGDELGITNLYIKRDDLSGIIYGGNKVRKLEFLLGKASHLNHKEILTFGFAGSNHALATAIYARQLRMKCTSFLLPQINAHYVRRNLLASYYHEAKLLHIDNMPLLFLSAIAKFFLCLIMQRKVPMVIPAGGSCPLGVIGYVNAALELRQQISDGEIPEPDRIYVPLGSMGTAAGLILGVKLAGLKSQVVPILVIEKRIASAKKLFQLIKNTVFFLRRLDPFFPNLKFSADELEIREDCLGAGYACFTENGFKSMELMNKNAGIILNGTYSAKAFGAIIDDVSRKKLGNSKVLFWNTYNSRDISTMISDVNYGDLPKRFHVYFEQKVQKLDVEENINNDQLVIIG